MSRPRTFRRHGDAVRMTLQPFEVTLLRDTHEALHAALTGDDADDPVRRRLFPATVAGDDGADRELRGLIFDDLLRQRLAGLEALLAVVDRVGEHRGTLRTDLVDDEPVMVLGVLNDLRLALGARIGVERLDRVELAHDDPRWHTVAVIDHFAWLQEQLLDIVDPTASSVYGDDPA